MLCQIILEFKKKYAVGVFIVGYISDEHILGSTCENMDFSVQ